MGDFSYVPSKASISFNGVDIGIPNGDSFSYSFKKPEIREEFMKEQGSCTMKSDNKYDFSGISTEKLITIKENSNHYNCYGLACKEDKCPLKVIRGSCRNGGAPQIFIDELERREKEVSQDIPTEEPSGDFKSYTNGGIKETAVNGEVKPMYQLLDPDFLEGIAKVLTMGAQKYAPDNWKKVGKDEYVRAIMSHYIKWRKGELLDSESGLPHLYHMATNAMFVDWHDKNQKGKSSLEDLPKVYAQG